MITSFSSKLGRKPAKRLSMLRNLVTSLILYESIRTTKNRAKAIQPVLDRMITKAKTRPLHISVRFLNRVVTDSNASRKIFDVLVERFKDRTSGYSSIKPLGRRKGDGAELVQISLVSADKKTKTDSKKK